MTIHHEHQPLFSNGKQQDTDGKFKLTPRKVIWITPETIEEILFLQDILKSIQSESIGKNGDTIMIYVYDNPNDNK
jgi:hypothetical protein